jgi:hypothetical protein
VRLDRTGVSVSDSAYTTEKIVEKIFAIVIHTGGIAASAEAAMARRGRTDASAGRSGEERCRKTSRACIEFITGTTPSKKPVIVFSKPRVPHRHTDARAATDRNTVTMAGACFSPRESSRPDARTRRAGTAPPRA